MEHCCKTMANWAAYSCSEHADPSDCPDNIISFSQVQHSYGIRVHDGGSSSITIAFCPWCGSKLAARSARVP